MSMVTSGYPPDAFIVPMRSGHAWTILAGHVFRIVTIEGPQVRDAPARYFVYACRIETTLPSSAPGGTMY
jgi:hypothetical protein